MGKRKPQGGQSLLLGVRISAPDALTPGDDDGRERRFGGFMGGEVSCLTRPCDTKQNQGVSDSMPMVSVDSRACVLA